VAGVPRYVCTTLAVVDYATEADVSLSPVTLRGIY
jgi:hypothetical protein